MFTHAKNSKQQGDIGLGSAIGYFTKAGYTVCVPLTDSQEYDLIVENGSLKKVQVKTSAYKAPSGNYTVTLKTCGGNQSFHTTKHFDCSKVDLLFILVEDGTEYCIPTKDMDDNKAAITLGEKYKKYIVSGTWISKSDVKEKTISQCLCGKQISKKAIRCKSCAVSLRQNNNSKKPRKSDLVINYCRLKGNLSAIGRHYNVSDNAVRKWIKSYCMA